MRAPWIALAVVVAALAACSEEKAPPPPPPGPNISYQEMPPSPTYSLTTCVVHPDKELRAGGRKPYAIAFKGYHIEFCNKECVNEFAKDPKRYILMVNPKAMLDWDK